MISSARLSWLIWTLVAACVALLPAQALALSPNDVPAPLKPWIRWVEERPAACPVIAEETVCVWPGVLELDIDDQGGSFSLDVRVDRELPVPLPGGEAAWPQDVTVPGNTVPVVLAAQGAPTLTLPPGTHGIRGRFRWASLPETLAIPRSIALIKLRVRGKEVRNPKRDQSRLWLKADQAQDEEPDSLNLDVFRHLEDGVPFKVETRLVLRASGRGREVMLGKVLLEGSVPLSLEAAIPVRLEQGLLYAQVYPGTHEIAFSALLPTPPEVLERPQPGSAKDSVSFWPEREVWVFSPNSQVRQVKLSGASGIDPQQTNLPAAWKQLAAYSIERGGALQLHTERRGEPEPPPNRLELQRVLWLDLDGQAYTVRDRWTGAMNRSWRLDLLSGQLGHVVAEGEDQLITKNPITGLPGVELRAGNVALMAEWRSDKGLPEVPAVGWSEDVQSLQTQIHVPPGWRILSASGVDSISDTWLSDWDLFALFFVLVVALAIGRLTHPVWGVLALVTLVLCHGEAGAPFAVWLCFVVGVALLKVIPRGWFRHLVAAYACVCGALLMLVVVSFAVAQVRSALYPQVQSYGGFFEAPTEVFSEMDDSKEGGTGARATSLYSTSSAPPADAVQSKKAVIQQQRDPEAVVQTGPGIPNWEWVSWSLDWSGPVHRDHRIRLYLLSPQGSSVLHALRTLLSGLLAFLLLRFGFERLRNPPAKKPPASTAPTAAAATAVVLGVALFLAPSTARAEIPSQEKLAELAERLRPAAKCGSDCISVSLMELSASRTDLRFKVTVHAGDVVSYQLPGPAANWLPTNVTVNGARTESLVLGNDGFLHLRLGPGKHRVELSGPVGAEVTLSPGTKPRRVEVEPSEFDVDGLTADGQVQGSLLLKRKASADETEGDVANADASVQLPSWVEVTRTLDFGVNFTVNTTVRRIGPKGSAVLLRIPLLAGERVNTPGVAQERADAVVNLGRDEETTSYQSALAHVDQLELVAAAGRNFSERWVLRCSTVWHCEATGVAPLSHQTDGHLQPEYRPWPGETLSVSLQRPVAESGRHTTIDSAELSLSPGVRLLHSELNVLVRTSTQDSLSITLPQNSEVQELTIDDVPQPFGKAGAPLDVSLSPGGHRVRVAWQQPGGMTARFAAPRVLLGTEVVNARVTVHLPETRWLLFAKGPSWGPAILFWGYLVLILLLAPVLGRLPHSPLRTWQWAILGLGLTQVPIIVAGMIVAWFFAFAWMAKWRPHPPTAHNFGQLGLAFFTLVFVGCLFGAVYDGLLSTPDMEVVGSHSHARALSFYVDRTAGALPQPVVFSTSLWVWRVAMLLWALWLSWNLIKWLRWAWQLFSRDGLWKQGPKPIKPPPAGAGGGFGPPFAPYPANTGPFPQTATNAGHSLSPETWDSPGTPPEQSSTLSSLAPTHRVRPHANATASHDSSAGASQMPTFREGAFGLGADLISEKTPIEPALRPLSERRADPVPEELTPTRAEAAAVRTPADTATDTASPDTATDTATDTAADTATDTASPDTAERKHLELASDDMLPATAGPSDVETMLGIGSASPSVPTGVAPAQREDTTPAAPGKDESHSEANSDETRLDVSQTVSTQTKEEPTSDDPTELTPPVPSLRRESKNRETWFEHSDELEERPTLPRMPTAEIDEPFTAFDFNAVTEAIEKMDSDTPPEQSKPTQLSEPPPKPKWRSGEAPEIEVHELGNGERIDLTPPTRTGGPPAKPTPPQDGEHHRSDPPMTSTLDGLGFPHKATPPGGFALEDLDSKNSASKPPPSQSNPPPKPRRGH